MTMTYYFALTNYRNIVNQIFLNEYSVKSNNIRIQTTYFCGGIGLRGGRVHQGTSGRGGHWGRGRVTTRKNDD